MDSFLNDDITLVGLPNEELNLPCIKKVNDLDKINDFDEYATWIEYGNDYTPAPSLKTVDKIPSGMYKMIWLNDDWRAINVPINTDQLYVFSEDFTSNILNEVESFWDKADIYKQHKITHKRGIMLCGKPGVGKTSIISLLVKQIIKKDGLVFLASNQKEFLNLTETLSSIIRKIEPDRPIITIIEDVDQLINMIGGDALILDFLDGNASINNHLIVLTSNDTTNLSEALLRPSRIDLIYDIPTPSKTIRKEYFENKGIDPELINDYVDASEGFSFAQMKELFIGTKVLGKSLEKVVSQINEPFKTKDYLTKTYNLKGI